VPRTSTGWRGSRKTVLDIYIGRRLRERRTELGMSQKELAAELGLSHQQVHKYEIATDRISASQLFHISKALDVTIPFFFQGWPRGSR